MQSAILITVSARDTLAPGYRVWATGRDEAVKIREETDTQEPLPPLSLNTMFENTVKKVPNHLALGMF